MNEERVKEKEQEIDLDHPPSIDQEKQDAQDDAEYADDDDVVNEINDLLANPTPKDMLSKTPLKNHLDRNVKVIGDASEINDVLDMDTIVNMHQQNDFEPKEKNTASTASNALHLTMLADNLLNMAEVSGIIDTGPINTDQQEIPNANQHVGHVQVQYENIPPTDLNKLNKESLKNMEPTQEEINQQKKEAKLKEQINYETNEMRKNYEWQLTRNGDEIVKRYMSNMYRFVTERETKIVAEFLDVMRVQDGESVLSKQIWDKVESLLVRMKNTMKKSTYALQRFADLQGDMLYGINYNYLNQRMDNDEIHKLRKIHTTSAVNMLSMNVEKLSTYVENYNTEYTSEVKQLKQDVAKYKAKRNKKPRKKKKPKFKRKQGGINALEATFAAEEYQKEVDEIHSGINAFQNDQAIRSSAWGVAASATDTASKNKPRSTEPEIQQKGNVRSFKHSSSGANIQSKGNIHSLKHESKEETRLQRYLRRTGQLNAQKTGKNSNK